MHTHTTSHVYTMDVYIKLTLLDKLAHSIPDIIIVIPPIFFLSAQIAVFFDNLVKLVIV